MSDVLPPNLCLRELEPDNQDEELALTEKDKTWIKDAIDEAIKV